MPKKLSCPSCGANLKQDTYYCDYCGAFFEKPTNTLEQDALKRFSPTIEKQKIENEDENLYAEDHFVSTEEIENSRLNGILISYLNTKEANALWSIFWVFLFFVIFLSGAILDSPILSIFIVVFLSSLINGQKEKQKELVRLYEKGAYQKAYQKLNESVIKQMTLNVIKQKALLCYYRLNKKEEAKNLIEQLHNMPHNKDVHISEVAQKLNVIYEPKDIYK